MIFDNGVRLEPKSVQELEQDGWEIVDRFANDLIMARGTRIMVVDPDGHIIIRY